MPVTININNLSLVHKQSTGFSTASLPDVCKTPSPGGPVPLPYPNLALATDLAKGTTTVKADGGNMCANYGSEFAKSTGDEPGTVGGIASGTFIKEATWITFSFDVKFEGQGACRLTDKMFHNHQNTVNAGGAQNPPLSPEDEKLVKCILEMCKEDKAVVDKARQKLKVIARNPKKMILHARSGGQWTQTPKTSLGSAQGNKVWINRDLPCEKVKETIYHEVTHTGQPDSMPRPLKEMDAYTKTEQWMNSKGKVGSFGKVGADGKPTVDTDKIRGHVERNYGYKIPQSGAAPPPPVTGRSNPMNPSPSGSTNGTEVELEDGTWRKAEDGDAYLEKPPQDLKEAKIPPDKLKCP
jgi:hypothetical protein